MSPVLNWPPVAVSVWVTESLLVTVTVEPGATDAVMGENMKFEMVTEFVALAVGRCTRSTATGGAGAGTPSTRNRQTGAGRAAATSTTAPPLRLRIGPRIDQTA